MSQDGHSGLDGLTAAARGALATASREARALGTDRVGTEHLLLGLVASHPSGAGVALRRAGVNPAVARRKVAETQTRAAADGAAEAVGGPRRSPRAERALNRAFRFANDQRSSVVRTEHLLLGLLDVEGTAGQVLRGLGTDVDAVRVALLAVDLTVPEPEPEPAPEVSPAPGGTARCPACGDPLTHLAVSSVPAGPTTATVYACPTCATALGVTPT